MLTLLQAVKTKLEQERNSEDSESDKRREDTPSSREPGRGKKRKRDQRGDNMSSTASTCSDDSERSLDSGTSSSRGWFHKASFGKD